MPNLGSIGGGAVAAGSGQIPVGSPSKVVDFSILITGQVENIAPTPVPPVVGALSPNVFPHVLVTGDEQDSAKYSQEKEDPAIRSDTDGGYVISRARFTRKTRRTWSSGFTFIKTAGKNELDAFWDVVKGGSATFQWRNPADGIDYLVRFVKGPLKFTYVGKGLNQRWDVSFSVEEA